jgi:AcrR family transcriptional regulator
MKKKGCRWRRRKSARPAEIIQAALIQFGERGFASTRLEDVAKRAGVTKGTVYLYFKNKEDLFRAVITELVLPEITKAESRLSDFSGSNAELIRLLIHQWWQSVGESPLRSIPKLIMAEAGNFPELGKFFVKNVVQRARRIFQSVIKRGIAAGEFRKCDVNHAVRVLIAPMVFAAIWERSLRPYDNEPYNVMKYIDTHIDIFLAGLEQRKKK